MPPTDPADSQALGREPFPDLRTLVQSVLRTDPAVSFAQTLSGVSLNLARLTYEGLAGGGGVRVTLNGEKRLTSISISPALRYSEGATGALERLVVAAFNDAFEKAVSGSADALGGLSMLFDNEQGGERFRASDSDQRSGGNS